MGAMHQKDLCGGSTDEAVAFMYGDEFSDYNFSASHPLQPIRLKLTYELLKAYGVFYKPHVKLLPGRMATDEELLGIHTAGYVDAVKKISEAGDAFGDSSMYGGDGSVYGPKFGIGAGDNPAFKGMHEAASLIAGSAIEATELVMSGQVAHSVSISGGLHHALSDRASGFCVYNDPACAIDYAVKHYGARVLYVDIDAHHGDGVQWAFYDRSDVLTLSLHESGRYLFPGTGFIEEIGTGEGEGYSVNVPFEPGIYDELYLRAFNEVVPPVVRAFKPDLIVSQNGCDSHHTDPLASMSLTTNAYEHIYARIHELAHEVSGGKLVALGGGGYQIYEVVPRAWTLLTAEVASVGLDNEIPGPWREMCAGHSRSECPRKLRDEPIEGAAANLQAKTEQTIEQVKQKLFPYLGLSVG